MNIVQVQFRNRYTGEFGGRKYSFIADAPVSVGDIVEVETANGVGEVRICRLNVPADELPSFLSVGDLRHI